MFENKEILIVEDDTTLSEMYEERIRQEGASVATAANGDEALHKINESHPNIVLLDIMLPGINGLEVLKTIKSDEHLKDIPVIVFSALNDGVNKTKALELGAVDYVVKSEVLPMDVIQKVESALR